MGNKSSRGSHDGLPPPIIPIDDGKKKKSEKKKKSKITSEDQIKANGVLTSLKPESQSNSTLFRPPRSLGETDGQLSKVILPDQDLNIKVYKKSRDNLNENFDRSRRYRSLPRSKSAGFRKSTDTLLSCESKQTEQLSQLFQQRCNSFAHGNVSFNSRWSYVNGSESPTFRPPGLKGVIFPTEEIILKNTSLFEKTYVEFFVDHYYASLPDIIKVSAIIIAYKRIYGVGEVDYRPISLREYFVIEDEQDIPRDLLSQEAKKWFIPAIPDTLLTGLIALKDRGREDNWHESQIQISMDLVRYVTIEAAKELSRIYEYQISVVSDVASVQILAKQAAERSAEYLRNGNRFVERDSLVEGTAYLPAPSTSHRNSFGSSRSQSPGVGFVSAIFGEEREQRWEVSHVFASCGLRLDRGDQLRSGAWPVFLTSRDALPLVYGYRSPICKKDFETGTENITQTELGLYPEVLPDNPNDFHRDYIPRKMAFSNCSSSFDSQSVGSLSMDHRRREGDVKNGRISQQSNTGFGQKMVGHSTRTSTLLPNGKYGSLARSIDFDRGQTRSPSHTKSFQRNMPSYQSERVTISGGRLPGYPINRPERISVHDTNNCDRGTLRKNLNGNGMNVLNQNMNGSVSSLSRNLAVGRDAVSQFNGETLNNRSMRPIMERNGKLARLPPKPPIRSTSQYNGHHHHHVQTSYSTLPNHPAVPVTAHVQFQQRLPPTTETSFDCNLEDENKDALASSDTVNNKHDQLGGVTSDFMDFQSFLKLVECQNANLKSLDQKPSLHPSNPRSHLETDFPEVEVHNGPAV